MRIAGGCSEVVKKYSNHIAFPIFLTYDKSEWNEEEKKSDEGADVTEQVNAASAHVAAAEE